MKQKRKKKSWYEWTFRTGSGAEFVVYEAPPTFDTSTDSETITTETPRSHLYLRTYPKLIGVKVEEV